MDTKYWLTMAFVVVGSIFITVGAFVCTEWVSNKNLALVSATLVGACCIIVAYVHTKEAIKSKSKKSEESEKSEKFDDCYFTNEWSKKNNHDIN